MSIATKAKSTKNFVGKHKVALTVIVTSAAWIMINQRNLEQTNVFLKEHGLYDEFYAIPEEVLA